MLKGVVRFTETAVLLSAILAIYGFTFLTVFSLNPKVDPSNASVLGASDSEANKAKIFPTITNISNETFEFRTSLEKYSDSRYVYTISFLNNGNMYTEDVLKIESNQTAPFYGSYSFSSASLDNLGLKFKKGETKYSINELSNKEILITEFGTPDIFGVELTPEFSTNTWETIKITIEL